jgi:RES domain-containing protein
MTVSFDDKALNSINPLPLARLLYRGVRLNTLLSKRPPKPLFVGDSANRYNLRGVRTLYFGENVLVAYAETVQEYAGLLVDHPTRERGTPKGYDVGREGEEPILVFAAKVLVKRVLDLTDQGIQSKLGVTEESLTGPWRWESSMGRAPLCQQLGDAVYRSGRFEAIRYPSEKAHDPHRSATHAAWAIFVERLDPDSSVEVSDVSRRLKGRLP